MPTRAQSLIEAVLHGHDPHQVLETVGDGPQATQFGGAAGGAAPLYVTTTAGIGGIPLAPKSPDDEELLRRLRTVDSAMTVHREDGYWVITVNRQEHRSPHKSEAIKMAATAVGIYGPRSRYR